MKKSVGVSGLRLFQIFALVLIFGATVVFATSMFLVTPTQFHVNESRSNLFNISVNNSLGNETNNITAFNVTIPAGFSFQLNTNGSNATAGTTFSNTSTVLTWNNSHGLVTSNTTLYHFWFNATANTSTIGFFNFTVRIQNGTGFNETNITVRVNDTSAPWNISFVSPTPVAYANISRNHIIVNVSVNDNSVVNVANISVFNGSHSLVNNTRVLTSNFFLNATGLTDGTYYINVTANDTVGNNNLTGSGTRTIVLDTTAPVVALTRTSASSTTQIVFEATITEAGSGVLGACDVDDSLITKSGSGTTTQTFTKTSVACDQTISFTVTCTDQAGNSGSKTSSFATDSCSSSSGGGGSGSSSSAASWTNTFREDSSELSSAGLSKALSQKERISIKVNGQAHHVGVKTISGNSVTIEVASTPQEATLQAGESKKFDTNADGTYDVEVTVSSISNGKANISVKAISVLITPVTEQENQVEADAPIADTTTSSSSNNVWAWIIGIIVVIVVIVLIIVAVRRK